jgi:DNA-binding PadR family transcriptional regulator
MSRPELNPTAASLLGFLHRGPLTGWELGRALGDSIGNYWNVTRSQIYRELRDLAERGYVDVGVPGPRDRTPYSITEDGRQAFSDWIVQDPGPDLVRSRFLLTVFFGAHLEPERLRQILADALRLHERQLEHHRALAALLPPNVFQSFTAATLRLGIAYEEMMVSWLTSLMETKNGQGH